MGMHMPDFITHVRSVDIPKEEKGRDSNLNLTYKKEERVKYHGTSFSIGRYDNYKVTPYLIPPLMQCV
jgi:hypothetical protein